MADYLLGVATVPVLASFVFLAVVVVGLIRERVRRWRPTFIKNPDARARHAASVAVAKRVLSVRVPGGWLAFYTYVPRSDDRAAQAHEHVLDALRDAQNDGLVMGHDA